MSDVEIHYEIPTTRDDLLTALAGVDSQVTVLWNRLDADQFFKMPQGGGWSPAGNLVHLAGAVAPVTMALRLPRLVPRLLFGRPRHSSRSFEQVRETYLQKLRDGASSGRFTPRPRPTPAQPTAARAALLRRWQSVVPSLCAALERWDDPALDQYLLPHPVLGKLTLREMLFFELYHLAHHANIVAARQSTGAGG